MQRQGGQDLVSLARWRGLVPDTPLPARCHLIARVFDPSESTYLQHEGGQDLVSLARWRRHVPDTSLPARCHPVAGLYHPIEYR